MDNWTAVDHLAPSTVHRMASTLHALFQYTVDDKKRLDNPADDLNYPRWPRATCELPWTTTGAWPNPGPGTRPSCLGAETGLRWGECAGITVGDLARAATLKVALQLDRGQALSPTKNKTSGAIDLSDAMVKEPSSRHVPLPARRREVEASPGGCVCRRWSLQPALELCGP